MLIWFEALTGKQKLLFHYLAIKFEALGHKILITSRPYGIDRANSNLDRLGREHISIGEYGGASIYDKLVKGSERIIELAKVIRDADPDILISFPSPDAFRTAYGLGIPSIQINDTPHAEAVARLTISLSNALVHPKSVSSEQFGMFGVTNFFPYDGVDEVLWTSNPDINTEVLSNLGLKENNYLVIRCEESKAAYFQKFYPDILPGSTIVSQVVQEVKKNGMELDIVAFPRYPEQEDELKDLDVLIPEFSVDTLTLLSKAKATMTAGGTMGRESALLGTPTLYSFPLELAVSTYLIDLGFPLKHIPDHSAVPSELIKLAKANRMNESIRRNLINKMETPFEGVLRALKSLRIE